MQFYRKNFMFFLVILIIFGVQNLEASTHFNPVDIVCGVRDYKGTPFNLLKYSDPGTGLITIKSKDF